MNLELIRKNYPITRGDIYLNHAATTSLSKTTIKRMQSVAAQMQRPLEEHFYVWLGILEDTRRRIAELIYAHPSEIAFCQNTSTALSLIANAIPFVPGDCVIVPRNEFPSNIYIWQSLKNKGVEFNFFDVEPKIPVVETLKKLDLKKVKLISVSAVSYHTGRQYELEQLAQFCKEHNILICYDAIQALGAIPFNSSVIRPDFIASGAQKWLLGSVGAGFIYIKKEWLEQLNVPLVGWTSTKYPEDFSLKDLDFATESTRFEPGLPDILPIAALNQSLQDLNNIGMNTIYNRIKANTYYLSDALNEFGIKTFADKNHSAGIVSFKIPDHLDIETFQKHIIKYKIHITQRENYIRISPHFYNTEEELDIFLSTLKIKSKNKIALDLPLSNSSNVILQQKNILLTGATGILGATFAKQLCTNGCKLTLIGRDENKLMKLKNELLQYDIQIEKVDLAHDKDISQLLLRLKNSTIKYDALINCAGIAETDEFINLPVENLKTMLQVNCIAPFQLMQCFLASLKSDQALGILNIVSPTGRCGWPLLSGYAASNAALWSLGEILARELCNDKNLTVTTYIAPPMHSRMQKRLGRTALRYFKLSGKFPYKQANEVAHEAWTTFLKKKTLYVSSYNRWTLLVNKLFPGLINKKIKKIWKIS